MVSLNQHNENVDLLKTSLGAIRLKIVVSVAYTFKGQLTGPSLI